MKVQVQYFGETYVAEVAPKKPWPVTMQKEDGTDLHTGEWNGNYRMIQLNSMSMPWSEAIYDRLDDAIVEEAKRRKEQKTNGGSN